MGAGLGNIHHAMYGKCSDPDCEIHNPHVIEDEDTRLTAMAWFLAGGERMTEVMAEKFNEICDDRDYRLDFFRVPDDEADDVEFYPQPQSLDAAQHFEQEDR